MVHSVSDVTRLIQQMFKREAMLRDVLVRGEISNFKRYASGHCYFTLKDAQASMKCVMFQRSVAKLAFLPENGMQVIALGSVSVYERDGVYQLYVNALQPEGAGALAVAFEQIKARLAEEGLFDEARKRPIPHFPRRIGVVTSPSGAVLRDIYRVTKHRWPAVQLILYPVQVQGDGAAAQIAEGVTFFSSHFDVDVLIVGRGGGSMEDLWAFNEEVVVRAIAASKVPVISAVGHETDFTLSDFAADLRAATPSQAGEFAVPSADEMKRNITTLASRLSAAKTRWIENKRIRLARATESAVLTNPAQLLDARRQRLDTAISQMTKTTAQVLTSKRQRVLAITSQLELLSPLRVLHRGYAYVSTPAGEVVRSAKDIACGQTVRVGLADGTFTAEIKDIAETLLI